MWRPFLPEDNTRTGDHVLVSGILSCPGGETALRRASICGAQVTCVLLWAVEWGPCAVLSGVHAVVTEVQDSSVRDVGDWANHGQETPVPGCVSGPWGGALLGDH